LSPFLTLPHPDRRTGVPAYPPEPPLNCDLIMKGGITSGIIYPGVVCRLARVYRLRSVGGASAAAIAAGAAAAAETGRAAGGFDKLETLPARLKAGSPAGGSVLFRLFQPDRRTAGLFRIATAGLGTTGVGRALRVLLAAARGAPVTSLLGTLPGVALVVTGATEGGWRRILVVAIGALVLLAGVLAGAAAGAARRLGRDVPANGFGLCSGMPAGGPGAAPALTPWLHAQLQDLAGRDAAAPPLTFGDMDAAGVELKMMTTNLTRRASDECHAYDPAHGGVLLPCLPAHAAAPHALRAQQQQSLGPDRRCQPVPGNVCGPG
jgi:hypothetical protein